jgi:hypothetical protein
MASRNKRTKKLSAPANETELTQYYDACKTANIEPADTLRKLAAGLVVHVAEHRSFTFPVRFASPKKQSG